MPEEQHSEAPRIAVPDARLYVEWNSKSRRLSFKIDAAGLDLFQEPLGETDLDMDPIGYFDSFLRDVEELSDEGAPETHPRRLAALAGSLSRAVFPEKAQEILRSLPARCDSLQIVTPEPWFPWEFARVGRLGDSAAVYLAEELMLTRWRTRVAETSVFPLQRVGVILVENADLPDPEAELRLLRSLGVQADRVPARYTELMDALASGSFDGWHFVGHGRSDGKDGNRFYVELEDGILWPSDLEETDRLGGNRPFVFWNACQAARGGTGLTSTVGGGWAPAFLDAGAGAFIGPSWSVRNSQAQLFAEAFYRSWLSGARLGDAVFTARGHLKDKCPGDPAWLAYAVFGHPLARVSLAARKPVSGWRPRLDPSVKDVVFTGSGPKRGWAKGEYNKLTEQLVGGSAEEFATIGSQLLRLILSSAGTPPDADRFEILDGDGLLYRPQEGDPLLVRFQVYEHPADLLGAEEVAELERFLRRLIRKGLRLGGFLLVHSRDARSAAFREGTAALFESLQREGVVELGDVWSYQALIRHAFDAMLTFIMSIYPRKDLSTYKGLEGLLTSREEQIGQVPLQVSRLVANQNQLLDSREEVQNGVVDPVEVLLPREREKLSLLLGGFGYGKTTAILRGLEQQERRLFYVPAAALDDGIRGAKDVFIRCIDQEALLEDLPSDACELYRQVARPVVEYLLTQDEIPVGLVLDGLDESPFLGMPGSLHLLINSLSAVSVPVVLSMRSEFWDKKEGEFRSSLGYLASHGEVRLHRIRTIELLPWQHEQIREFVRRYRDKIHDSTARERVMTLEVALENGEFDRIYSDIPKRPLFLRFIVESVADTGLPGTGQSKARLFRDWARRKILRDLQAPRQAGGRGRLLLGLEDGEVVEKAWYAMQLAAASMTVEQEGRLELTPAMKVGRLRAGLPAEPFYEQPLPLYLTSLIHLTESQTGDHVPRIQFAHRAFQEFFLAWHLVATNRTRGRLTLPESVEEWVHDIEVEGLVQPGESLEDRQPPGLPSSF